MYTVRKTGRAFGIFRGTILIEGGFFSRDAANLACDGWNGAADLQNY